MCFFPLPAGAVGGGGNGAYDIIRSWEYVCDVLYWLVVRTVTYCY